MFEENKPDDKKISAIVDEALLSKLGHLSEGKTVRVLIRLREEPVRSASVTTEHSSRFLQERAACAQKPIIEYLTQDTRSMHTSKFKCFWLVNLVFAELSAVQIRDLAKLPGVEKIYEDMLIKVHPEPATARSGWDNIGFTGAPLVWAQGYRGQNVKVAVIDTGVDINHPELLGALGGTPPYYEGYWIEFDEDGNPVEGSTPHDTDSHGTHVSGTAVGRNRNVQIGMAPDATLGHALVLPEGSGTWPQVIAGLQWAYENGFQVINGSLGGGSISVDLQEAVNRLVAAGTFPVFSIGNDGPGETSPPGNTPLAVGVGAFDSRGEIAEFSGGGIVEYPDYDYPSEEAKIKPDISAPGVAIISAVPGGKYAEYNGTSMASPHVAGAAALLLSKNPNLSIEELKEILYQSVGGQVGLPNDPGAPGKDTRYGWGRLNVAQAVDRVPEPGPHGVVEGYIMGENEFVTNARLTFSGPATRTFITDAHGFYQGTLPEGTYQVQIAASAYLTKEEQVQVREEEVTIANFTLEPAPLGTITGVVVDARDFLPLADVFVEVVGASLQTVTNVDGYFSLNLKEGRYTLIFTKTGYYPLTVEDLTLLPGQRLDVNVELVFGYRNVFGQILDESGHPVSYAFVQIAETEETTFSDAEGNFVVNLPAGTYRLNVDKVGYRHVDNRLVINHGEIFHGTLEMRVSAVEIYFENHFDLPEEWAQWEASGGWHVSSRRYVTPEKAAWNGDESSGKYSNNQLATLRIKEPLTIPAGTPEETVFLNFHFWGKIERDYDYFRVFVESENVRNELYEFSALSGNWQNIMLDLTAYAGKSLIVSFEFTSDSSVVFEGIYLDDVYIYRN